MCINWYNTIQIREIRDQRSISQTREKESRERILYDVLVSHASEGENGIDNARIRSPHFGNSLVYLTGERACKMMRVILELPTQEERGRGGGRDPPPSRRVDIGVG